MILPREARTMPLSYATPPRSAAGAPARGFRQVSARVWLAFIALGIVRDGKHLDVETTLAAGR